MLFLFLNNNVCNYAGERDNLFEMVEVEWEMRKERRDKRLAESAALTDQSESASQQDDDEDDEEEEEDEEEDECIVKVSSESYAALDFSI